MTTEQKIGYLIINIFSQLSFCKIAANSKSVYIMIFQTQVLTLNISSLIIFE